MAIHIIPVNKLSAKALKVVIEEFISRNGTDYGAVAFLKSLPYVRLDAVGIMGHSLGAEMAYRVALDDPTLAATVITGYDGYAAEATPAMPRDMLMIIGQYDEFRGRMTGTRNIEKEWMAGRRTEGIMLSDLGVSFSDAGFHLDGRALIKAFIQRLPSSIILRKEMPFRRFLSRKLFNSEIFWKGRNARLNACRFNNAGCRIVKWFTVACENKDIELTR